MIRDKHNAAEAHRAMAQVTLLFAIAPAIAPILGGWLQSQFGWRSIFWFLSGFAAFLILLVAFIDETLADEHRQAFHPASVLKVYVRTLMHRRFLTLIFSLSFTFVGLFLYVAGAPTIIYDFLGLGSDDFALQFIPMVAGLMLGAYLSSQLAHRWPMIKIVTLGFIVMMMAVLFNLLQAIYLDISIITVIAPLVIYAFGLSLVMPAITILALDCFPQHRGTAASLQGFFQMLMTAGVASIAIPLLHSQLIYFSLGQALSLILAFMFWRFAKMPLKL